MYTCSMGYRYLLSVTNVLYTVALTAQGKLCQRCVCATFGALCPNFFVAIAVLSFPDFVWVYKVHLFWRWMRAMRNLERCPVGFVMTSCSSLSSSSVVVVLGTTAI